MWPQPACLRLVPPALALIAGLLASAAAQGTDEARRYGQHLSQECTSCHRLDGVDNGIPSITGWDVDTFIRTLKFYQDGVRTNPVMVSVAKSLDDDQLRALALYWATVPRPPPRTPAQQKSRK